MKTLLYTFIVILASATSPTSCQEEEYPEPPTVTVDDEWVDSVNVPLE